MAAPCLNDIDTVILAGGLGTRMKDTLGDTPKLLAPIGDIPFLDILVNRLKRSGARRVILGLGTGHTAWRAMGMPPVRLDTFRHTIEVCGFVA